MIDSRPTGRALYGAALAYPGLFIGAVLYLPLLLIRRHRMGSDAPITRRRLRRGERLASASRHLVGGRSDPGALAFAGGVPEPHEGTDPRDAEQGPQNRIERRQPGLGIDHLGVELRMVDASPVNDTLARGQDVPHPVDLFAEREGDDEAIRHSSRRHRRPVPTTRPPAAVFDDREERQPAPSRSGTRQPIADPGDAPEDATEPWGRNEDGSLGPSHRPARAARPRSTRLRAILVLSDAGTSL